MLSCKVSTKELEEALKKLGKFKNNKSIEAYNCVKIEIKEGKIELSRMNKVDHMLITIQAETDGLGYILLNDVKEVTKSFKSMEEWQTKIDIIEKDIIIKNGNRTLKFAAEKDEGFIKKPEIKDIQNRYTYNTKSLHERMKEINVARSKDNSKPILCGIHFNEDNMVALDGCRLAISTDSRLVVEEPFTLDTNTFDLIFKTIDKKKEEDIEFHTSDEYIVIKYENVEIRSKLLNGDYFKYKDILPKEYDSVVVNTKELKEDIAFLSNYTKNYEHQVTEMNIAKDNLEIKVNNESGIFKTDRKIDSDIDLKISFNNKHMLDALKVVKTDEIELCVASSLNPILLKNKNTTHFILPLRVSTK